MMRRPFVVKKKPEPADDSVFGGCSGCGFTRRITVQRYNDRSRLIQFCEACARQRGLDIEKKPAMAETGQHFRKQARR